MTFSDDFRALSISSDQPTRALGPARVVTPDGVLDPGWVEVTGGRITAVAAGRPPGPADHDLAGRWLVPGFVDIHVHGGAGASFTGGDGAQAQQVAAFHRAHGTTTLVASLVSGPLPQLERATAQLSELVDDGVLAGVHLEGPFLSAVRCGAHDPAALRPPARADLQRLLRAGRGTVAMVTLAPELDGGLDAVRVVAGHGAVPAIGHTDATYDTTRQAIAAGARVGTHLFNGMRSLHHREPGPVPALLEDGRVTVELICDGVHLHPAVVRTTVRTVGAHRTALVTDAMAAAGAADGSYTIGGMAVRVERGVAQLADGSSIAGSTLTTAAALRTAVQAGLSVPDAVRALSTTPAAAIGLATVGAIRPGLDADLVVLEPDLAVHRVMAKGRWAELH